MAEETVLQEVKEVEVAASVPLSPELLAKMNAYWRAANFLSVGQIYLKDNPLLKQPLTLEDIKPRLLGHWGTTPGLNFLYVHLNRAINERNLNMIYIIGPGHGGPGIVANTYLEGSYTELYPAVEQNADGIKRLFRQFSWPLGIPSHVAPETPGSIHEGGELGYSLVHAYGAAFDNPDLVVACVVGDGEAETGPLATSWHSNKFLNPARDGAVLPNAGGSGPVDQNAEQPGLERRPSLEPVDAAEHADPGVLDDFLGNGVAGHEGASETQERRVVPGDERQERGLIAGAEPGQQLRVGLHGLHPRPVVPPHGRVVHHTTPSGAANTWRRY